MAILWDPEKARSNFAKHGVTFDEAETIFYDPLSKMFDDPDHSVGEQRFVMVGYSSSGRLVVVSHTEHGGDIRIINARLADARERKRHES